MSTATVPLPPCPECAGEHLRALTFRHRTSCSLYERDSATAAADHDRGRGIRDLTDTERTLIRDEYEEPDEGWELAVQFDHAGGIHWRKVVERAALFGPGTVVRAAIRRGADDAV